MLNEKVGCFIGDRNASILIYADDVILLSPTFSATKKLLNVCEFYSLEFGLKFNVKKVKLFYMVIMIMYQIYHWTISEL